MISKEDWDEFIIEVKNTGKKELKALLEALEEYGTRTNNEECLIKARFLVERVIYPIANKEPISCKCGCHHGYIVEFEFKDKVVQNTICMVCSEVQAVETFDIKESEECLLPTSGTWLSRLLSKMSPKAV
jgi:hypothetical protein